MDRSLPEKSPGNPALVNPPVPFGPPKLLVFFALGGSLSALAWVLFSLTSLSPPPPPAERQPLDFKLVEQRYGDVRLYGSRGEVEELLGPPTQLQVFQPELKELEERLENGGRNFMPKVRIWDRWTDPNDKGKWVAVLFEGYDPEDMVYGIVKKGF